MLWALLVPAAAIVLLSAIGLWSMRTPFQRLNFVAPPACISGFLVLAAVALDEKENQGWMKCAVVALLLFLMNGVVTHATARAAWIRRTGHWPPREGDPLERFESEPRP